MHTIAEVHPPVSWIEIQVKYITPDTEVINIIFGVLSCPIYFRRPSTTHIVKNINQQALEHETSFQIQDIDRIMWGHTKSNSFKFILLSTTPTPISYFYLTA